MVDALLRPARTRVVILLLAATGALLVLGLLAALPLGARAAAPELLGAALVVAAGACLVRAALETEDAATFVLLALSLLLLGVATAAHPWPGPAGAPPTRDPLRVAGLAVALAALAPLLRDAPPGRPAATALDAALGSVTAGAVLAAFAGDALVAGSLGAGHLLAAVLAILTAAVASVRGWRRPPWTFVGLGLLLVAAGALGPLVVGGPSAWIAATAVGGALLAAAAWWRTPETTPATGPTDEPWATVLAPMAATGTAAAVLAAGSLTDLGLLPVGLALVAVVVAGVRTAFSLHEIRAMGDSRREARTDDLTRLGNRRSFAERADAEIILARDAGEPIALVLLDLDRFKDVNDTLGHEAGDRLLRAAGLRLARCQPTGRVYRLGGDEFVMLLPVGSGAADARRAADTIRMELERPVEIEGVTTAPKASVGIAVFPDHGANRNELLRAADIAMYRAKREHVPIVLYSREKDGHRRDHLQLASELADSIENGDQLAVFYQPKANLRTGELEGVEALVRWEHPTRGLLGPGVFLPLAARHGLMRGLTLAVLDRALQQQRAWREAGLDIQMAVNLAAANVLDIHLPIAVSSILQRHDARPDRVVLEISEDTVMLDPERTLELLSQLVGLGVSLSLDDFGTGHSSLTYLKRLPIRELKVDGSFVMGMLDDPADETIVQSTVALAGNLGLHVVAEGVETQEHWERLRRMGCDTGQGYLLARPLPAVELAAWARARQDAPAQDAPPEVAVAPVPLGPDAGDLQAPA